MGSGDGVKDSRAHLTNEVWLVFGDGRYLFKLKLRQIAELQEKCRAGIGTIYMRVMSGDYYDNDLSETIRLGLAGGACGLVNEIEVKVSAEKALILAERYCDRPLVELWELAQAILGACVVGYSDPDQTSKKATAATETMTLEPDGSISPRPTQTESLSEE